LTEFQQRLEGVSEALGSRKVDALLVSSPASIQYLTGFTGSNGLLAVTGRETYFFTDPRYGTDARANISCRVEVSRRPLLDSAAAVLKRRRLKK
jgi:Xaa-Pro aminopeptidase